MKKIIIFISILIITTFVSAEPAPQHYKRIASMTLGGDEILLDLVSPDRIAGLSGKINRDIEISNITDRVEGFPEIEGNIEVVLSLDPDLVITSDWIKKESILQIEDTGIATYVYKTPDSWEEQINLIKNLAHLVEADEKGMEIIKNMETHLTHIQEEIRKKYNGKRPRILLYTSMETTAGKNTMFDSIINLLLGENAAAQCGITGYEKISKEKVIEMNPDIIIIPLWNRHPDNDNFINFVQNDRSFQEINAVKNHRIHAIEYRYISTTSQYIINGVEKLGTLIYPTEDNHK